MLLSEAIRLGSTLKPQAFDQFSPDGSCALRAAQDAVGIKGSNFVEYGPLMREFQILSDGLRCPSSEYHWIVDFDEIRPLVTIIWHLNDYHKWTRQEIADFVESIEIGGSMIQENELDLLSIEELEEKIVPNSTAGFLD